MKLIELQWKMAAALPELINEAIRLGYKVTLGDAYRDPRVPYGHAKSCHKLRLAIDLNLFKDGRYITNDEGHRDLHVKWTNLGGSPMITGDPNHYSMEWEGVI